MSRVSWTDERIDERMAAMEEKIDRLFDELAAFRAEFSAFQRQAIVILGALAVSLVGVLAAAVLSQS